MMRTQRRHLLHRWAKRQPSILAPGHWMGEAATIGTEIATLMAKQQPSVLHESGTGTPMGKSAAIGGTGMMGKGATVD
eukprot:1961567-Amphidinium_carterae.2